MSVPARHGTFDLEALDDKNVFVYCADPDCKEPVGVASILEWGTLAEAHFWEKVKVGG